jgi:hypothetical protein
MRLTTLATLCLLTACSGPKGDTTDIGTTDTGRDPSSSTIGMSSQTVPTSTDGTDTGADTGTPSTTTNDSATTGGTTISPDTTISESSDGPVPLDLPPPDGPSDGLYLFAVSTVIAPGTPFQFLATVEAPDPAVWSLELQPLTLDVGSVISPRQPIGEPLKFTEIPVTDDAFALDLGLLDFLGQTNPVTGSDITAELQLAATIQSGNFFCGTVTGMVLVPLEASLDGSTFAAVKISDPAALPTDVTLDCAGNTAH